VAIVCAARFLLVAASDSHTTQLLLLPLLPHLQARATSCEAGLLLA
jgi:hypothetical protein